MHECTHLCTHIVMYTACTLYICHTYSTYTYSTFAFCIVTEMESCAQHIHTLMYNTLVRTHTNENIKHVYTHSHTHIYIASKVYSTLVLCTCTCIVFHLTALCMYSLSLCSLRVEPPYGWFSVHGHSHHRSLRCEIKLSYWAQPLLNLF